MSRSSSNTPQKVLRIGIVVGGLIVEERLVRTGPVSIGQSSRNTFAIPSAEMPRSWPLFAMEGGLHVLRLAPGMRGRLSEAGEIRQLAAPDEVTLGAGARGKIMLGATTVLFQMVAAPPPAPRPTLPAAVRGRLLDRVDLRLAAILFISLLAHGSVVGWVQAQDTPRKPEPDEIVRYWSGRLPERVEPRVDPSPQPAEVDGPASPVDSPATPFDSTNPPATPGSSFTPDPVSDEEARARQEAQARGAIALIGARSSNPIGRFTDVTEGKNPGGDLQAGVDRAANDRGVAVIGTPSGVRGPSTGQIGIGGGPDVVGPEGGGHDREIHVDEGDLPVIGAVERPVDGDDGGLDAEGIYAKIKSSYYGQVQKCYQDVLKGKADLRGRVDVTITIGPAGGVTSADVDGFDSIVDACIQASARRWRFAKPPHGSATFQFPFTFRPAAR